MCFNNCQYKNVVLEVHCFMTLEILSPNVFFRNKDFVDIVARFPRCLLLMALAVESVQDGYVNTPILTITRNSRQGNSIHGKPIERLLL